ncbi:MAG TPA: NifU family protein [Lacipirellulaceae bacterium]|nr:NifU family protein [Lacipirellulaceae bacterium]
MTTTSSFERRIGRIESLVERIEQSADPSLREAAREMVRCLLELHAEGLRKILHLAAGSNGAAQSVLDAWLKDDLVRSLLLLHELHPESLESRVRHALENVRPYLRSHGGNVELLELGEGRVRLRMDGNCHGCPSSAATLRDTIERAILELAPDAGEIEVEGLSSSAEPGGLVSLELPNGNGFNGVPSQNLVPHASPNGSRCHLAAEPVAQEN